MTVVGRFLLLIILAVIFRVEDCKLLDLNEDAEAIVRRDACSLECSDEPCITNCIPTKQIKELDEEAGAYVRLICRDQSYLVLGYNPGHFLTESRLQYSNSDYSEWNNAFLIDATQVVFTSLGVQSSNQFRSYRISTSGISMPEITGWMKTFSDRYRPKDVTSITIERFDHEHVLRSGSWEVKIRYTPSEDRPCYHKVTCQQDDGPYNQTKILERDEEFSVKFERLPFAVNFTLTIKSLTDNLRWDNSNDVLGTTVTFSTPRCVHPSDPKSCSPKTVTGLNATATHKTGNIFDVNVTWDKPDNDDRVLNYSIDIHPIGGGTEDRVSKVVDRYRENVVFPNVTILGQYDVYIRGENDIATGPTISRHFTTGLERIDIPENIGMPIYLTASIVIMVIGIGAYGYHRLRRRRLTKRRKPVDEFEMDAERLTITRVLGIGAFGVVKYGSLRDDEGNITLVAVKMLQDDLNENERRNFLHEIKIMKAMDEHPNIICLLGCNTTGPYPFLVVEYCSRGDLQSFLRKSLEEPSASVESEAMKRIVPAFRSPKRKEILKANSKSLSVFRNRDNYVQAGSYNDEQDINSDPEVVTVMDMLNFGRQIATGMEFLSSSRVVHRDLAARNILVCCDRTVKISDFGLSRDIYKRNVYKKSGNGREPLKWMAIEALTHQIYTTCSDVWSFGILLWEIMTRGGDPYPGIPTIEILNRLHSGYRMERPANCSIPLYNVMLSCWKTRRKDRPTFTMLRQELDKLIAVATNNEYYDLEDVSEEMPLENYDSQIPSSHSTSDPPQVVIVNDSEPPIITVVETGTMDEPETS